MKIDETIIYRFNRKKHWHGKESHFEHYGEMGADPSVGVRRGKKGKKERRRYRPQMWTTDPERGRYNPFEAAEQIIDNVLFYWEDPEVAPALISHFPEVFGGYGEADFDPEELLSLFYVPMTYADGIPMDLYDRWMILETALITIQAMFGDGQSEGFGEVYTDSHAAKLRIPKRKRYLSKRVPMEAFRQGKIAGFGVPKAVAVETLAYELAGNDRNRVEIFQLRLKNVGKNTAARFIKKHHSALPYLNPKGLLFSIGLYRGNRLVAVATANTPSGGGWRVSPRVKSGELDVGNILELTRVASDGSIPNASSVLTSRIIDLLPYSLRNAENKNSLFVTYSLNKEEGSTYKALKEKGLRPVAYVPARISLTGARKKADVKKSLSQLDKIRWEAGPAAEKADWSLIRKPKGSQMTLFRNPSKSHLYEVLKKKAKAAGYKTEPGQFIFYTPEDVIAILPGGGRSYYVESSANTDSRRGGRLASTGYDAFLLSEYSTGNRKHKSLLSAARTVGRYLDKERK